MTPKEAVEAAEQRDPGNPFVAKLRKFLEERGYLTEGQVKALDRVQARRVIAPAPRRRRRETIGEVLDEIAAENDFHDELGGYGEDFGGYW